MVRATEVREAREVEDEDVLAVSQPVALPRANRQQGRYDCPRCEARLLFDSEKLACLMCGYEHSTPRLRSTRRSPAELLDALPLLRAELSAHVDSLGGEPEAGSPGAQEFVGAIQPDLAALQFGRLFGQQALVSAGQSLIALARGLEPPTPEYGTWSVARTVLDSASLVCWLLEQGIDTRERAARALALQANDLEAECHFLSSLVGCRGGEQAAFAEALDTNRARRHEVMAAASALGGLPRVPEASERAELMGAQFEYVMCSSIVDGRPWALLHTTALQSGLDTDRASSILITQVQLSADWYARAVWAYVSWMSPSSLEELRSSLDFGYDSIALPDDVDTRFWREDARPSGKALRAR